MPPPVVPAAPVQPPKARSKPAGPPPQPVPIKHSAAFILKQRKQDEGSDASASNKPTRASKDKPFTGNAVQYWLRKADQGLDEIEEQPTNAAKALYEVSKEVSKSPVGSATAKGVELVAKLSIMAGKEAVKVAVPAAGQVAKWAVAQGARAAMGAVQNSVRSGLAGEKKDTKKLADSNVPPAVQENDNAPSPSSK